MRTSTFKTLAILLACFFGAYLALPTILTKDQIAALNRVLPSWLLPKNAMTLGLDLQGGVHAALEVDKADLIRKEVMQIRDDARRALREAGAGITGGIGIQPRGVQLRPIDKAAYDKALPKLRELSQPLTNPLLGGSARNLEVTEADGIIRLTLTEQGQLDKIRRAIEQAIEVFRKRLDPEGVKEISIQRQGPERIVVQVPGAVSEKEIEDKLQPALLEFRLLADAGTPEPEREALPQKEGGTLDVLRRIEVEGKELTGAEAGFDSRNNEPVVNFRFNIKGAQAFARITSENLGKPFAIILDGKVISAPVIQSPILQGSGQISGRFTVKDVNDLAVNLRSGALPAKFSIIEARTVGAGLGSDSIGAAILAAQVSGVLVIGFTLATYGLLGAIAIACLVVNLFLIFGLMSLIGATLTLPGIAGLILTVAMAVDSNVLIYERIREEARAGRSVISALDSGFNRALATILDSNLTTFLAGAVLYFVGTGPVKGFAVTLCLGIITTIFTAFSLTRLIVGAWYRWFKPQTVTI